MYDKIAPLEPIRALEWEKKKNHWLEKLNYYIDVYVKFA